MATKQKDSNIETENKKQTKETEKAKETSAQSTYVTEYTINELAEAAKAAFDTHKVIVLAALRSAGKEAYTMEEAKKIVTAFKQKEVK